MPHHRFGRNALNRGIRHIVGINIADKRVGRIFGQLVLKSGVGLAAHLRIIGTARLRQIPIHRLIGVAAVICTLPCAEHFIQSIPISRICCAAARAMSTRT